MLSGHRLKLHIPKEGVTIAFNPSGVRCPQRAMAAAAGRPAVEEEPYWQEALAFTRDMALQVGGVEGMLQVGGLLEAQARLVGGAGVHARHCAAGGGVGMQMQGGGGSGGFRGSPALPIESCVPVPAKPQREGTRARWLFRKLEVQQVGVDLSTCLTHPTHTSQPHLHLPADPPALCYSVTARWRW